MDDISNERLYYELRAQHRRLIAMLAFISLLLALLSWAYWQETGQTAASYAAFGSAFVFAGMWFWLLANEYGGRYRTLANKLFDTDDWPADLKRELRDRGKL